MMMETVEEISKGSDRCQKIIENLISIIISGEMELKLDFNWIFLD